MERAIIVSASSDIGYALGQQWLDRGREVYGTYRTASPQVDELQARGSRLVLCDLASRSSTLEACETLRAACPSWDILAVCAGLQEPICPFLDVEFGAWETSVMVNFVSQLRVVRELLPTRRREATREPTVLLFAGGGPNKATVNYSAYAVSKVALVKMCELLDAEIHDTCFVIVNPGWVKTKGHTAMLAAGARAGTDYQRVAERFAQGPWTSMERVIDCCEWIIQSPRELVGGRYFGVEFDDWESERLAERLAQDPQLCKLRRRE